MFTSVQGKEQIGPSATKASKTNNAGKETTSQTDQLSQPTSVEIAKLKSANKSVSGGAVVATAPAPTAPASVTTTADELSSEPAMDESALDSLIDTLGGPEEDGPAGPVYTGPEVMEDIFKIYLEELGKREGSLPPEYVKLLKSEVDSKDGVAPKKDEHSDKPMTDDELADALSSDFTCSTASTGDKKKRVAEKPSKEGEIVKAEAASSTKSSAPPKEKKKKSKEEIKDDVMEALLDTIGEPEPEPEEDLSTIVEMSEVYIFLIWKAALNKMCLLVTESCEFKSSWPLSESDLPDEFSKDFACPAQPVVQAKPSKPSSVPEVGHEAAEALEALSSSLGKREPDPEEKKPAVDKVKEKTKQEDCKKMGEDGETILPEYRLREAKDKDGKPLLPKPEEKSQPMNEKDLLEGLTEGFSCSPAPSAPLLTPTKKNKKGKKSAGSSEIVSAATGSSVHSAAPPASTFGGKEMDEALDRLSDSLGQREPDPDENKPVVDKVKEKAKSEQRDKLGERDDTIPPESRKLLESGEQDKPGKQGRPAKDGGKSKEKKKPTDDSAAIGALSDDSDTCAKAPATPQHSKNKSRKNITTTKPTPKEERKPKDPKKAREQSSSSKSEKQKAS
ncbi:calpastatin-like [Eudromia elegans]